MMLEHYKLATHRSLSSSGLVNLTAVRQVDRRRVLFHRDLGFDDEGSKSLSLQESSSVMA